MNREELAVPKTIRPAPSAPPAPLAESAGAEVPEAIRNPLLRRVDWRFLLPDPRPARSLCLCAGPLADAVRLVSGRVDGIETAEPEVFDLAVAERADVPSLAAAVVGLRAGGHLYVEDGRDLGTSEEQIRRYLGEMGLRLVGMWAPLPRTGRGTPEQWVPLEAPDVARNVMRSRTPPRSLEHSIRRGLAEVLWAGIPAIRHRAPFCVLAERVGGGEVETADAIGQFASLPEAMRSAWSACGLGPTPDRTLVALLTGGRRSVNKVVALAFPDGDVTPGAVVKIPRVDESIPGLDREAATLTALSSREPRVKGIPRILLREMRGEVPVVAQTFMPGRRVGELLDAGSLARLAESATDWQIALSGGGRGATWSAGTLRSAVVEPAIADFGEVFGDVVDAAMLDDAIAIVREVGAPPVVCEQRDFSPWNVLVAPDGSLSVLDWESSQLEGLPLLDLVYFLAYAFVKIEGAYDTGDYAGAYRAMQDRVRPNGDLAGRCMERYADRVGVSRDSLRALRILGWMTHARSTRAELAADGRLAGGSTAELRRHPYAQFWAAEVRYGS